MNIDFRHLRYIAAIAEHGSFTHAARALHMEQPPLSQQVRALEQALGLKLFVRSRQGAVPTEAGAELVKRAGILLQMRQEFTDVATGLARGERGSLRVGLAGAVSLLPLIPAAIRQLRLALPHAVITMEESNTPALCAALTERTIDVAIIRPPAPGGTFAIETLFEEPTLLAVPVGHPAAGQATVALQDVAQDPLILFPRALGPGFFDAILAACQNAGFTPQLGQEAPQITAAVPLVAAGLGVSIVPACLDQIHAGGAVFRPIAGTAPRATLAVATRPEPPAPLLRRFVETLREQVRGRGAG
nr:LysR family transcriptional regulator [Gluconacetobacter takamatsuzukensis]